MAENGDKKKGGSDSETSHEENTESVSSSDSSAAPMVITDEGSSDFGGRGDSSNSSVAPMTDESSSDFGARGDSSDSSVAPMSITDEGSYDFDSSNSSAAADSTTGPLVTEGTASGGVPSILGSQFSKDPKTSSVTCSATPLVPRASSVAASNPRLATMLASPPVELSNPFPVVPSDLIEVPRPLIESRLTGASPRSSPRLAARREQEKLSLDTGARTRSMKSSEVATGTVEKSSKLAGSPKRLQSGPISAASMLSRARIDSHGSELEDSSPNEPEGKKVESATNEEAAGSNASKGVGKPESDAQEEAARPDAPESVGKEQKSCAEEETVGSDVSKGVGKQPESGAKEGAALQAAEAEIFSPNRGAKRCVEENDQKEDELFSPTKKVATDPKKPPTEDNK